MARIKALLIPLSCSCPEIQGIPRSHGDRSSHWKLPCLFWPQRGGWRENRVSCLAGSRAVTIRLLVKNRKTEDYKLVLWVRLENKWKADFTIY